MYRQHRLVEFLTQNKRLPNQKLYIRGAEIHIRIDRYHSILNKVASKADELIVKGSKRRQRNEARTKQKLKIWIFQLIHGENSTDKMFDQMARFCASFDIDADHLGWQKLDLTETIREWYSRMHDDKLKLLIDCTGCGNQYRLHLFGADAGTDQILEKGVQINANRPFLVLHTETKRLRRVRRRAVDCGGALNGQCCKESFYVSFKALGWDDWIIAPRGYFANYCRGECTGPFRTPDTFQTFHSHFIEEYRKMGLLNGMKPCCAPVKFSSMSLIYYGDDGIIKRDLPKMVVDECGCP